MLTSINTYKKNNLTLTLYTNPNFKGEDKKLKNNHLHVPLASDVDAFEDFDYDEINKNAPEVFKKNKIYVCDMYGLSSYRPLEYLEICQSISDSLLVNVEVNFRISEWTEVISLLSFVDSLKGNIADEHAIISEQDNLFDEDLIHLKFQLLVTKHDMLTSTVQRFSKILFTLHQAILAQQVETKALC